MEKMFCLGLALGMVGGALVVANSYKMRSLVKKSQAEFMDKVNDMVDEKLNCNSCEQGADQEKKRK